MRPTPTFDIDEPNAEALLLCPHCGNNYVHHDKVSIYSRPHEDGAVRLTTVYGTGNLRTATGSEAAGNPSGRRDGVAIEIWCEGCGERAELTIAQHKGQTCLQMRVVAP